MDVSCSNDLIIAVVAVLVAVTTLVNQIVSYNRHQHIMSDNQRLLKVVESRNFKE